MSGFSSHSQTEDVDELPFMVKHRPSEKFVNSDLLENLQPSCELPVTSVFSHRL